MTVRTRFPDPTAAAPSSTPRRRAPAFLACTATLVAAALLVAGCAPSAGAAPEASSPDASPTVAASPTAVPPCSPRTEASAAAFAQLERDFDARVGVFAFDTGTGEAVAYRADERFAFASTFKALAAAAVLDAVSLAELDDVVTYAAEDLVPHSPVTERFVDQGLRLREVAEAAVQQSDNTAGNLLLDRLGGTAAFDAALTALGDETTESARTEPALNDYVPGDTRDTSTPRALATDLCAYAVGDAFDSADKRTLFGDWLRGSATGDALIRSGVPEGWTVGDKSGAADYATRNDIAVLWRPDGAPIVVAVLTDRAQPDAEYDDALVAAAAAAVVEALGG